MKSLIKIKKIKDLMLEFDNFTNKIQYTWNCMYNMCTIPIKCFFLIVPFILKLFESNLWLILCWFKQIQLIENVIIEFDDNENRIIDEENHTTRLYKGISSMCLTYSK